MLINMIKQSITYDDFCKIDIRVGKIIAAEVFINAIKPAYKLTIDFGNDIGIRTSSAQITDNYTPETLLNTYICAVINLPKKQIGTYISEVLVLGCTDNNGVITLIRPDHNTPLGAYLH